MFSWNGQISEFSIFTVKFGDLLTIFSFAAGVFSVIQATKAKNAAREAVKKSAGFENFLKVTDAIKHVENLRRAQSQNYNKFFIEDYLVIFKRIISDILSFSGLQLEHKVHLYDVLKCIDSVEKKFSNGKLDEEAIIKKNTKLLNISHSKLLQLDRDLKKRQEEAHVSQ